MSGAFNSGYGHCDVAAALLERKASFFMLCFLFCKIWGFDQNSWEIHFQLSFFISNLHRNFMNVGGRLIPHDGCGVFFQADLHHRSNSQLTALAAACQTGSARVIGNVGIPGELWL